MILWMWIACAQPDKAVQLEEPVAEALLERETSNGPVRARIQLSPKEVKLGDPIVLQLEVTAQAGVTIEMPPFGEALGRLSIVDFSPAERIDPAGSTVHSHRYTLQAPMSGPLSIPSLRVVYIDGRDNQDPAPKELLTDELAITVQSLLPEDAPLELRPPRGELSLQRPTPPWVWALLAVPLLVGGAWWWRRNWLAAKAEELRRSAYENALDALRLLEQSDSASADVFYEQLSELLRAYISDRFTLNALHWTTEELLDAVRTVPELSSDHRQSLRNFCHRADEVKFAQTLPPANQLSQELILVRSWLEQTRVVEEVSV